MKHHGGERFELIFVAKAHEAPPIIRIRHLLKSALRTHGLRCVSARDVTPRVPAPRIARDEPGVLEATPGAPVDVGEP